MYKTYIKIISLVLVVIYSTSCVDTRKAAYFYNAEEATINSRFEDTVSPVIQKNDILSIVITSLNSEASSIFNISNNTTGNSSVVTSSQSNQVGAGYLVNSDGNIQLPILGFIPVAGRTTKAVKESITATLLEKKLLIDPIVTIHHLNYEVTVIGEVGKPSVINVPSEKISLLKALGLAGDITVYGKKNNVLLIREINGKRRVKRLDLNSPDFLRSPYYYLQPNDVVYVEANKQKISNASGTRQTIAIVLSGLSLVLLALDRFQN